MLLHTTARALALAIALAWGPALAAEVVDTPAASLEQATRQLGRFPASQVPDRPEVRQALALLGHHGRADHLPLLEALARDEGEVVGLLAQGARERILERAREAGRSQLRARVPGDWEVDRWLEQAPRPLLRRDGTPMGAAEARTVAYAAILLGPAALTSGDQLRPDLLGQARDLEDQGDVEGALLRYAAVAATGDSRALEALDRYGLDPERLLLGLSASSGQGLAPSLETDAMALLAEEGSVQTMEVLVERATNAGPRTRIVALDGLGRMLRSADLPPGSRDIARRELEAATLDPQGLVRDAARLSLSGAGVGHRLRGTVVPLP